MLSVISLFNCWISQYYISFNEHCKMQKQLPGFNCGEAVNFAIGEWFPLGALASQRYALLKRTPLLPYEELLCKEAALLDHEFSTCDYKDTTTLAVETHSQRCMKVPFVQLMRVQHRIRWSLMKMGARTHYKADIDATVLCGICRRDCYVAHIMCNCRIDAICLCHGKIVVTPSVDIGFI